MNSKKIAIVASLFLAVGSLSSLRAAEVDQRQHNQEERIEQGEKSGELTKHEAKKLQKEHKAIHQQVKADRAENGGKLTKTEKKEINQEQNKESRQIHAKKHNARHRKAVK